MRYLSIIFKMIYLVVTYIIRGIDRHYYLSMRGSYFADLNMFKFAINDLKEVSEKYNDPNAEALLGWCYSQINSLEKSLKHYRNASRRTNDPEILLGLAYVEHYNGNTDKSKIIVENICADLKDNKDIMEKIKKFKQETGIKKD